MTLKEAVESGRPFKRKGEVAWCMVYNGRLVLRGNATYNRYTRHITFEDDLKANDFEIEEFVVPDFIKEIA